jgi:hypothetical protein
MLYFLFMVVNTRICADMVIFSFYNMRAGAAAQQVYQKELQVFK